MKKYTQLELDELLQKAGQERREALCYFADNPTLPSRPPFKEFSNCDFSGLTFSGEQLCFYRFNDCDFVKTRFSSTVLDCVDFSGSDLTGAYFHRACLTECIFANTNLSYCDFSTAVGFDLAYFDGRTNLYNAVFGDGIIPFMWGSGKHRGSEYMFVSYQVGQSVIEWRLKDFLILKRNNELSDKKNKIDEIDDDKLLSILLKNIDIINIDNDYDGTIYISHENFMKYICPEVVRHNESLGHS